MREPDRMTTPSLTPEGDMRWPPRDWVESLCAPQPDGTWLVQAPIWLADKPLLYLLPGQAAKDRFKQLALGLVWLRIAISYWLAIPLLFLLSVWGPLLQAVFADPRPFLLSGRFCLFVIVPLGLVYLLWLRHLFTWLSDVAVTPPPGWKRPDLVVRRAEEWQALHLANGWRVQRVLFIASFGITVAVVMVAASAYLNVCQDVGILDQLVLGWDARQLAGVREACPYSGWSVLVLPGAGLVFAATGLLNARQRQAGRARPLAPEGVG